MWRDPGGVICRLCCAGWHPVPAELDVPDSHGLWLVLWACPDGGVDPDLLCRWHKLGMEIGAERGKIKREIIGARPVTLFDLPEVF